MNTMRTRSSAPQIAWFTFVAVLTLALGSARTRDLTVVNAGCLHRFRIRTPTASHGAALLSRRTDGTRVRPAGFSDVEKRSRHSTASRGPLNYDNLTGIENRRRSREPRTQDYLRDGRKTAVR